MFTMRGPLTVDLEVAAGLAAAVDAIAGPEDLVPSDVFAFLARYDDYSGVIETLFYGCHGLLDILTSTDPDVPVCETSDTLAELALGLVVGSSDHVRLGQAILRIELDEGSLEDLPSDLRLEIAAASGSDLSTTLIELITGMSAMVSVEQDDPRPGDPLRQVFGL
jgi:hypothetical protein